jgi:geranylgeranyl pyrophosphate synthase
LNGSEDRLNAVLDYAEVFLHGAAGSAASSQLLIDALRVLRQHDESRALYFPASAHLPLLVYESLTGAWRGAVPLAAAATLVFVGVDVLDDLMDGDASVHWRERPPAEILLGAATLIAAAPQALLGDIAAPVRVRAQLQRLLARGLLEMSAGQLADVQHAHRPFVALVEVIDSVNAKSGAMLATFAAMAVVLAGPKSVLSTDYAEIGRMLGVASQLRSDCRDIFGAALSRDLRNGTRTAPVVMRLEQLEEFERAGFLDRVERAGTGGSGLDVLRQELIDSKILDEVATLIELHCQAARQLLEVDAPLNRGAAGLRAMIDELSMLGSAQNPEGGSNGSEEESETTRQQEGSYKSNE